MRPNWRDKVGLLLPFLMLWTWPAWAATNLEIHAGHVAPLIDPAKLATLGPRGANPRVHKCVYWLEMARRDRADPAKVIAAALRSLGMKGAAASLTQEALLRDLSVAKSLGCLDPAGLEDLRQGKAPTIRKGPHRGDQLVADHDIPRSVCPELDNVIANLVLIPSRVNASKSDSIGSHQQTLARQLYKAGLLSKAGLEAVRQHR